MYIVVDDRESVANSYVGGLVREGVSSTSFSSSEFCDWLPSASEADLAAIDAFLLGESDARGRLPPVVRKRSSAPIIALTSLKMLKHTLELFEAGVDDVVHVPIHLREIIARTAAIARRSLGDAPRPSESSIRVFYNGRDPEIAGRALALPRRELRIVEYMVSNHGKWLTKTQIFNAVYGIFESTFDESVIESHVSKLRKKVREFVEDVLGHDRDRAVTVVSTGDESPMMRRLAPKTAMAIAEYFRDRGESVLLVVDSITRFAHACREVRKSLF